MIGMAQLICDDLGWGWTPDQIARDVHANLDPRGVGINDVGAMVGLAHRTLLPHPGVLGAALLSGDGGRHPPNGRVGLPVR